MPNNLLISFKPIFPVYNKLLKSFLGVFIILGFNLNYVKAQMVYIKEKGGIQIFYLTNEIKNICISSGSLKVNRVNGIVDSYPLSNIRYFNFVNLTTGSPIIKPQNNSNTFLLFPNPAYESITLPLNLIDGKYVMLKIISINGRVVYEKSILGTGKDFQINISELPAGIYICRITSNNNILTSKFIKK